MKTGALCLGAPVLFSGPAIAGAWPQPKGEGQMITTYLYDRGDAAYGEGGERVDEGWFYKDEVSVYAEYGLNDRITLIGRAAWQQVARRDGDVLDAAEGLAASELGVRAALWRGDHVIVSGQLTAFLPGQGENVSNRPLGSGERAWEGRLLAGRSLGERGFLEAQAGWRLREGADLDEARIDLTAGWRAGRWALMAQSFSVWSVEAGRIGSPDFHQHKLQLSIGRRVGETEFHLGGYVTPAGRNAIEQRAVFLQVWRRF